MASKKRTGEKSSENVVPIKIRKLKSEINEDESKDAPKKPIKKETNKLPTKREVKVESKKDPIEKKDIKLEKCEGADNNSVGSPLWTEFQLLAEQYDLDINVSKNIVKLFEEGNTVPFVARYRKHLTNNMTPEEVREMKNAYEEILVLKNKINTVVKTLIKSQQLDDNLKRSITSARTIEELEYISSAYKKEGKRTLAARAKDLGLEPPALALLYNQKYNLHMLIQPNNKDLQNIALVEKGVMHIIVHVIATDMELLTTLRSLRNNVNFVIKCKKIESKSKTTKVDETKYENYFNFLMSVKYIKPHQILAINRGENAKVLSVKVVVPDQIKNAYNDYCFKKYVNVGSYDETRKRILIEAIEDAYSRLVQPLIIREIRADLKAKAEKASCEVFSTNLKNLLLIKPLKGKKILAIDPGIAYGCKIALISETGRVLDCSVIDPFKKSKESALRLEKLLKEHNCELIALGNGKACRETEEWLTKLIETKQFYPLDVNYTIVNEDGASVYSCSPEAKKEFPDMDPNLISAVSLARRVQDPLAELVKVEPRHLGVGMYQHDIKEKHLKEVLNEVVSECVSFVGVDLNTTSQCLLKHVAGLSDKKAALIIDHRNKNGPFINRKQLLDVKGIGKIVFQQCAGFLQVGPVDCKDVKDFYKNIKTTKLDATYIHPESYSLAERIIKKFGLKVCDLGESTFIKNIQSKIKSISLSQLSQEFNSKEETIKLILDSLEKELNHDLRNTCSQEPLFRKSVTNLNTLNTGDSLTGRVTNVTHFGCFVDVGVGTNGLIHSSKLQGYTLKIGDKVEVKVLGIDISKKKIQLQFLRFI